MTSPYKVVHRAGKSAVIDCSRRVVVKVFRGRTARRRAVEYLEAVLVGYFGADVDQRQHGH